MAARLDYQKLRSEILHSSPRAALTKGKDSLGSILISNMLEVQVGLGIVKIHPTV